MEEWPMFERFTDRARRVLVLAQEEARLLGHPFIGTEHVLLGLLAAEDGMGARALTSLGVKLEPARARVSEILGSGITAGQGGSPPFTPRAKKVLELSLREALQLGQAYIGTEHLLLGLVREGEGVACQVLVGMGVDLGRVRQEVIGLMGVEDAGGGAESHGSRLGSASVHMEEGRRLRADIEAALDNADAALLRRYLDGEVSEDEEHHGSVTRALAEALVRQQDLLRRLAERILPDAD
jgi:ATP-dependent Clp protease ATP-binding subunit ClpC